MRVTDRIVTQGIHGFQAEKTYEPARVEGLENIVAVAAGWGHSLALAHDGKVYAWGCRSHGQLGDGARETGEPVARPQAVPGLEMVKMIAADGTVYAFLIEMTCGYGESTKQFVDIEIIFMLFHAHVLISCPWRNAKQIDDNTNTVGDARSGDVTAEHSNGL